MASQARQNFDQNFEDIEHLLDLGDALRSLDKEDGGNSEQAINVLYRSAVVLMISHWEAYIEDICSEALSFIIDKTDDPKNLPKELKKKVNKEVKEAMNETEAWKLAGSGWKVYLRERVSTYLKERNRNFNTPKPSQIEEFIKNVLGFSNITDAWEIDELSPTDVRQKLNDLIELRGQIAHRGKLDHELTNGYLLEQVKFLRKLVAKTGGKINTHVTETVGSGLWEKHPKKSRSKK